MFRIRIAAFISWPKDNENSFHRMMGRLSDSTQYLRSIFWALAGMPTLILDFIYVVLYWFVKLE
ncbi:hypothetical protein BC938DRAFT_482364 [Jimgerdemannia flammicorona]|uniref:Uncharacterized protein n=1 Tax=Jimgerdemannia flammicorona TaxID=994334 RepID=A0A433QWC1_9FUNG|nr:hypothetical protein BC938DRAFT_482364 [Jimgerdemannia flammicorona]